MADCETKQSESKPSAPSLKTSAQPSQQKLQRIVTLVTNMKKSPWLLSRCSRFSLCRSFYFLIISIIKVNSILKKSMFLCFLSSTLRHIPILGDDFGTFVKEAAVSIMES